MRSPWIRSVLLAACATSPAAAATYSWSGADLANWTDSGVWGAGASFPVADDIANIAVSAARTINMGSVSVGRINTSRSGGASTWNVVLGSSSLTTDILTLSTTTGGPILEVGGGTQVFMYATIAGTQGFTKQGTGTLSFRFNNTAATFTGNVTHAAGSIILQSDGSLGAAANDITFTGNATLEAGNTSGTAISLNAERSLAVNSGVTATLRSGNNSTSPSNLNILGVISGDGGVTASTANAGFGTVTLSGANTYAGTTTVDRVTLILAGGSAIANTGTVNLNNLAGTVLQLNASETIGGLTGGGATGGTVNLQTFNLAVNTASNITYAGAFSGTSGKLIKQGAGTLTLTGAATHTGGVEISNNGGVLRIQNAGALGSGTINLAPKTSTNSGTLELALAGTNAFANAFGNFSSATSPLNGAGTAHIRNVTGNNSFSGNLNIAAGGGNGINLESVAGGAGDLVTFSGIVDNKLTDTRLLSLMGSGLGVISGELRNTGGGSSALQVYKAGAGTWTLSGANAHAGLTQVADGVLRVTHSSALGTTALGTSVAAGAALELQGGVDVGAEALTLAGTGVLSGGALRNLSGANSWAGAIALTAATTLAADAGSLALSGAITGSQALTLAGAGDFTLSGSLGISAGALLKTGSGNLTLSGPGTYSGGTTLSAGITVLGHDSALGTGAVSVASGATLRLAGFAPANTLQLASGSTLDVGSGSFSGTLSLASGANLVGTGSLSLGGNVDLTGVNVAPTLGLSFLGGGDLNLGSTPYAGDIAYTGGAVSGSGFTGFLVVSGEARALGSGLSAGTVKLTAGNGAVIGAGFNRPIVFEGGLLSGLGTAGYTALVTVGGSSVLDVDLGGDVLTTDAAYDVLAGSTLKGSATFNGAVTVAGTLAPGNSPGLMTYASGLTLGATSVTEWEFDAVIDVLGSVEPGVNTDLIEVTGGEFLLAAGATLRVLAIGGVDYTASSWDLAREFAVINVIAPATHDPANAFILDTSGAGLFADQGSWSLFQDSSRVSLVWTPVPEPSTYGLLLGGLALAAAALRRKKGSGPGTARGTDPGA